MKHFNKTKVRQQIISEAKVFGLQTEDFLLPPPSGFTYFFDISASQENSGKPAKKKRLLLLNI